MSTALIIGQIATCQRVESQLDLLRDRPVTIGWVLTEHERANSDHELPIAGHVAQLEAIVAQRRPSVAIVSLPAAMRDEIQSIRTRLRRMNVADRFFPTIEDQLAGIGPRTNLSIDLNELLDRPSRSVDEQRIRECLQGKRVMITGAGGSIGSELVRKVAAFGPSELQLVERSENALFEIDRQVARSHPQLSRSPLLHDIVEVDATQALVQAHRPEIVLHAAAHKHVPMMECHPQEAIRNNLFGTKSIVDAAHAVGAERFVMISTDKAVNPTSIMGATKRLAEMYVQHKQADSATAFSMVRFGNVLGSSGSVLDVWAKQIADGGPITITDPRMTRFFMTIPEAASLVLQAASMTDRTRGDADVFLLDMGEPAAILDLAARFAHMHGLLPRLDHSQTESVDSYVANSTKRRTTEDAGTIRIVVTGARPGEKLHEELTRDTDALQPTDHPDINIWRLPQPSAMLVNEFLREFGDSEHVSTIDVADRLRCFIPEMRPALAA